MKYLALLGFLLLPSMASAEFFVCYTTATGIFTRYEPSIDPSRITATPTETCAQIAENNIGAQRTIIEGTPRKYLKVVNSLAVEMNQAEKAAIDAPGNIQAAYLQGLRDEIANDNFCNIVSLTQINTAVDNRRAALQTDIDAITNIASAKAALTTMNTQYWQIVQKLARCLLAHSKVR